MPFKYFLTHSIGYERTHQLIIKSLFSDPEFLKITTGISTDEKINVVMEPYSGLFDLGLFNSEEDCLLLIEIKMWSALSKHQLERQTSFLEKGPYQGLHILLGTSDLQFYSDENHNEIAERTNHYSSKVGYKELISLLEKFVALSVLGGPAKQMAQEYRDGLLKQHKHLEGAWLNEKAHLHHRCFSTYNKIKQFLVERDFMTYQQNNPGGVDYILNDQESWAGFKYKGHEFEVYQEMVNNYLMIRIASTKVPSGIRNEVKRKFLSKFYKTEFKDLSWSDHYRASTWHKIIAVKPKIKNLEDCRKIADLFNKLNPVIKSIARTIR